MLVCGVDEAGRGPLVGAVYAAAVILDPAQPISGLADSKKLSEKQRERLEIEIKQHALAWSIAYADAREIDQLNILQATMLAMARAVQGLTPQPERALIDGNRCPKLAMEAQAIVKGDATVAAISAASILAKTARDAEMTCYMRAFRNTVSTDIRAIRRRHILLRCSCMAHVPSTGAVLRRWRGCYLEFSQPPISAP